MIQVIENRRIPFILSSLLVIVSIVSVFYYGLKPGIDFTGGSLLELSFQGSRSTVVEMEDIIKPLNLGNTVVQPAGDKEMILRFRAVNESEHQKILQVIREATQKGDDKVLENRFETIGPTISSQLRQRSVLMGILVIATMISYVAYAFRKVSRPLQSWKYGVAAVIGVLHNIIITLGVFAFLGNKYGVEVDIPFIVALLTIMGYSVNDTIVVFDRIRENLLRHNSGHFGTTVNAAINQTFARSFNTSFAILLVLFAMFFYGGASIHYFILAMLIGIAAAAYSSIFLVSPILVLWDNFNRRSSN